MIALSMFDEKVRKIVLDMKSQKTVGCYTLLFRAVGRIFIYLFIFIFIFYFIFYFIFLEGGGSK